MRMWGVVGIPEADAGKLKLTFVFVVQQRNANFNNIF